MESQNLKGSWSAVCTARAPKDIIFHVIDYHLKLGASRFFIFFDDPEMAFPHPDKRVKNVICDDEYWKNSRPVGVAERQRVNLRRAQRWTWTEWTTHVDTDELISCDGNLVNILSSIPEDVDSVLMPPLEAIYFDKEPDEKNAFDTVYFKKALKSVDGSVHPLILELHGDLGKTSKHGLFGHVLGKSFSRVSTLTFRPPIHGPKEAAPGRRINYKVDGLNILHFDAMTFEDFKRKQLRRLDGSSFCSDLGGHRDLQMKIIEEAYVNKGEKGIKDIYRNMVVFDEVRLGKAMEKGLVVKLKR